jgi:hypothetical protein
MPRTQIYSMLIAAGCVGGLLGLLVVLAADSRARRADTSGYELLAMAVVLIGAGIFGLRREVRKKQQKLLGD